MRHLIAVTILTLLLITGGCASNKNLDGDVGNAEAIYLEGKQALDDGYFETAIEQFELLEARYPFGEYAQQIGRAHV